MIIFPKRFAIQFSRLSVLVLVTVSVVSGCSGSSDALSTVAEVGSTTQVFSSDEPASELEVPDTEVPDTEVPDTEVPDTEVPDTEVPDTELSVPNDNATNTANNTTAASDGIDTNDSVASMDNTVNADTGVNETTSDNTSESEDQPPSSEPTALLTTRVTFDITVPAYLSDALQVRMLWGDSNFTAAWVMGETWTVSYDLPTDTANRLTVTFSDQNGAIIFGCVEQNFRTGTAVSQSLQIAADQFDTAHWDFDNDGLSNLNELIAGSNPLGTGVPQETGSIYSAEVMSVVFDIAGGKAVAELRNAVRALVRSTDGSAYRLLSTTPSADIDDFWTAISDIRLYECPLFGTVQRSEHRREGWGLKTLLVAENCSDSEQTINGKFNFGRSWASGAEVEFTSGRSVSLIFNNGVSELIAEYMEQNLPIERAGIGNFNASTGSGRSSATNISLTENGVSAYRFGLGRMTESNLSYFAPNVSEIVTPAIDIDEIRKIQTFRKSDTSEFFTSGSFVANKGGVQVLLIDADTGDENTFNLIATTGDSTSSEIVNWSAYRQFNGLPLAE